MSVTEKLLIVQERDCRIRDLEKELRDIPVRKEKEESRINEHKELLVKAEDALKGAQAQVKEVELESELLREKITKLRQQQMEIKTNKEFKAMEVEIQAVAKEVAGLEEQELVLMEKVDKSKSGVTEGKESLVAEEALLKSDLQVFDKRAFEIEAELEKMRVVRKDAAKDIDHEWLERYEIIFSRKDKALVALENGICGGCHLLLAPYVTQNVRRHSAMVMCDFCGRMLC